MAYFRTYGMQWLDEIPAGVRLVMVFGAVLVLMRKKVSLGNSFLFGALGVSTLFAMPPTVIAGSLFRSATDPKTVGLALVVALILVLSNAMESSGQMRRMLDRFQGLVANPRLNLIVFPALIGLLPMPGGAVFSAPLVRAIGQRSGFDSARLSFVNYWFRHLWEYWWPLYPCVLLTTALAELNLWLLAAVTAPVTLLAVALGYFSLRDLKPAEAFAPLNREQRRRRTAGFLREMTPIITAIGLGLISGVVLSTYLPNLSIARELGLIAALCVAVGVVWRGNSFSRAAMVQNLRNPQIFQMAYLIAAILIFKGILEESGAVNTVSRELLSANVPLVLIAVLLPLLVGVITGLAVAFAGIALPIVIPLIEASPDAGATLPYVTVILISGMVGVLLSPLHLCLLLSNQFFGVSMGAVYRCFVHLCLVIVLYAVGLFFVLQWVYK
jgi:integral membrane protein (TIGR00529 family)